MIPTRRRLQNYELDMRLATGGNDPWIENYSSSAEVSRLAPTSESVRIMSATRCHSALTSRG
jgi:hypothetical protein